MDQPRSLILWDMYRHYKYYHFYSVCFGLGWGMALYRPFRSLVVPVVLAVFFIVVFELAGIMCERPPHRKRCRGRPYDMKDVCCGFAFALFVAVLNLNMRHACTMSYGCGIIVFALSGAIRKYYSLWDFWKKKGHWT